MPNCTFRATIAAEVIKEDPVTAALLLDVRTARLVLGIILWDIRFVKDQCIISSCPTLAKARLTVKASLVTPRR